MRLIKLLLSFTLCLGLIVVANAHPGRTDQNGGHYDRDTGEYHYHHGYSAHQHTDMDGDGDLDCPYQFEDKAGTSSGSGNSYGKKENSSVSSAKKETISSVAKIEEDIATPKQEENAYSFGDFVAIGICIFFAIGIVGDLVCKIIDKVKRKRKK